MSAAGDTLTKKKKIFGLAPKFIIGMVLIVLTATAGAVLIGAQAYWISASRHYHTTSSKIAAVQGNLLDSEVVKSWGELVKQYRRGTVSDAELAEVTESELYRNMYSYLENLRISLQTDEIFIVAIDNEIWNSYSEEDAESGEWKPFCYIMDSCIYSQEKHRMGDAGSVCGKEYDSLVELWQNGQEIEDIVVNRWHDQYVLCGYQRIMLGDEPIALVGVKVAMLTIKNDLGDFVIKVILAELGVVAIVLIIGIYILFATLIRPIRVVTDEAVNFVKSDQISMELDKIKTGDEIQTLSESFLALQRGIKNSREDIKKYAEEREHLTAELSIAERIQADMLPKTVPQRPEIDLHAIMSPAKNVGADFYDYFMVDTDRLALVIGDISGKGVPASLFMVITKTLIRDRVMTGDSPSRVLSEVNARLCEDNKSMFFSSAWLGILNLKTGEMAYSCAGHEYPVFKLGRGRCEVQNGANNPPLAAADKVSYSDSFVTLQAGDSVFLYTDGVTQAKSPSGERYGMNRMLEFLVTTNENTSKGLLDRLYEELEEFDSADHFDDITMMNLIYKGSRNGKGSGKY